MFLYVCVCVYALCRHKDESRGSKDVFLDKTACDVFWCHGGIKLFT